MGGKPASGEPRGLADAKPNDPGSAPKWNPKNRGLEQPPRNHIDNTRRSSSTAGRTGNARSARGHGSQRAAMAGRRPSCAAGASATRARTRPTRRARPIPAISSARRATPSTATRTRTRARTERHSRSSSRTRGQGCGLQQQQKERPRVRRHVEHELHCRRGGPQARHCPHQAPQGPAQTARRITRR